MKIVDGAVKFRGKVFTGQRHYIAYAKAYNEFNIEDPDSDICTDFKRNKIDGFITDTGEFVDRKEGKIIATKANQFLDTYKEIGSDILFTEDIIKFKKQIGN